MGLEIKKYAAIDIGSNAVRLLVANVIEKENSTTQFRKSSLVRVPVRLGADSFTVGIISENSQKRMINTMKAFKLLMDVHGVEKFKACATSAMREAKNGQEVVENIFKATGVQIDIIDGETEAAIISSTELNQLILGKKSYLYVDVGGGSTELTLFSKGKIVGSKSFKIGTVRVIDKETHKATNKQMKSWIKESTIGLSKISLIGSGGNINKIFKMSMRPEGKPLSYVYMKAHYKFLKQMTYEQRITELGLNPDRADVIIPASKIYINAMKWSGATNIFVPQIGLADGIVKALHLGKI
ncbi:exopolyphosphatase [Aureibaculum sp. 2210JD6-5]|uniref:Ppx/GppA phosphatase family protein n=1 Tax=Aureibaculum sp. 2210JD6-5 TaxID=3103957 RepID=UPI002AAD72E6|nr:exopolyphosphatase [Aureibaculum sp. 2210JD6-5]MDY7395221.1 exopolyphosphatase [Aureibaculum sp. 2210JD6-5]